MKKWLEMMALLGMTVVVITHTTKADTPKVPAEIQVRILKIQKDQIAQQAEVDKTSAQYQQAYNTAVAGPNKAIQQDLHEIQLIKDEAVKAAGLDPAKFDLDVEKLIFVAKPATEEKKPAPDAKK
jgi:hypothetical protein